MFPIYNGWSVPSQEDDSWRNLKVGDQARVRAHVPLYGTQVGTLTEIGVIDGMYILKFSNGQTCGFDPDDLLAGEKEGRP